MYKTRVFICLLILSTSIFAQEVKVTFTDLMVMGNDASLGKEYLFTRPFKMRTDSKNNIYLQEYIQGPYGNTALIKKYSSDGKFIAPIGQKGEGPGDFKHVVDFTVLDNDDLLIVDMGLQRLTYYDRKNNKYTVSPRVSTTINYPEIFQLGKDKILVVDNTLYQKDRNILFIKSFDWKTNYYDFGHPSLFIDSKDPLITEKIGNSRPPINTCIINENKIVAVPNFYDGMLTFLTNEKGNWRETHFYGFKPEYPSYENIPEENRKDMFTLKEAHAGMGSSSKYAYKQHAKSYKLFTYKNKYILHILSVCHHPSIVNCYMDIFDMNGKYLGKNVLFDMTNDPERNKLKAYYFLWKDKDDNFYVVEYANGLPVIKKVRMDIAF